MHLFDRPSVTAPRSGRVIIRAPYRARMRERLVRCGGTPQWEAEAQVWTMPQRTLASVVDELLDLFGEVRVVVEVPGGRLGSTWLEYERVNSPKPSLSHASARDHP